MSFREWKSTGSFWSRAPWVAPCTSAFLPSSANTALTARPNTLAASGINLESNDHFYHRFGQRLAERGYVVFAPYLTVPEVHTGSIDGQSGGPYQSSGATWRPHWE